MTNSCIKNKINEFNCDIKRLEATAKRNRLALLKNILTTIKEEEVKFRLSGNIYYKYNKKNNGSYGTVANAMIVKECSGLEDEVVFKIRSDNYENIYYVELVPNMEITYSSSDNSAHIKVEEIMCYNKNENN